MATIAKDDELTSFDVPETARHPSGHTIYKIVLQVTPKELSQNSYQVCILWQIINTRDEYTRRWSLVPSRSDLVTDKEEQNIPVVAEVGWFSGEYIDRFTIGYIFLFSPKKKKKRKEKFSSCTVLKIRRASFVLVKIEPDCVMKDVGYTWATVKSVNQYWNFILFEK